MSEQIELHLDDSHDALFLSEPPENVSLSIPPIRLQKSIGFEIPIDIIITVATGVSSILLRNWLYEKLKNSRSTHVTINHEKVKITQADLTIVIEETTKVQK